MESTIPISVFDESTIQSVMRITRKCPKSSHHMLRTMTSDVRTIPFSFSQNSLAITRQAHGGNQKTDTDLRVQCPGWSMHWSRSRKHWYYDTGPKASVKIQYWKTEECPVGYAARKEKDTFTFSIRKCFEYPTTTQ